MKERWEATCDKATEPDFLQVVWAYTLNTQRYERAAAYICRQHNLRSMPSLSYRNVHRQGDKKEAKRMVVWASKSPFSLEHSHTKEQPDNGKQLKIPIK